MGGTLTFNPVDVARLIVHAVDSPERQSTWTAKLHEGARRAGVEVDDVDIMEWDNLVQSVGSDFDPGPSLTFVHDQGIYVMSNGTPQMDQNDPKRVIYAEGFDPRRDSFDKWWEGARDIVGGDDFVESLPLDSKQIQTARFVLSGQWPSPGFFIEVEGEMLRYGFDLVKDASKS